MSPYRTGILAGAVVALALASTALAQQSTTSAWIHVAVTGESGAGTTVNVNLPLSVAEVAFAVGQDKIARDGKIRLLNNDISVADLRKLWNELRATGDAQLLKVVEKNQTVTVSRKGRVIQIRVNDTSKAEAPQTVSVDVPVNVLDALLAGTGNELDIKNAIAQLRTERGDIVRVRDGKNNVRIWIDETNEPR